MMLTILFLILLTPHVIVGWTEKEWERCVAAKRTVDLSVYNAHCVGLGYKTKYALVTDQLAIIFMVENKGDTLYSKIPPKLGGCPTDVIQSPMFENHKHKYAKVDPYARHRPVIGGISIGPYDPDASGGWYEGTLGIVMRSGKRYTGITAGHNLLVEGTPSPAIQPAASNPTHADYMAHQASALTELDLCCINITEPARPGLILQIGSVKGMALYSVGDKVSKFGIESLLTEGIIKQIDATAELLTGEYHNVIIISGTGGPFSTYGDSGSVVISEDRKIVGLLRGGAAQYSAIIPWAVVEPYCELKMKVVKEDETLQLGFGDEKDEL